MFAGEFFFKLCPAYRHRRTRKREHSIHGLSDLLFPLFLEMIFLNGFSDQCPRCFLLLRGNLLKIFELLFGQQNLDFF